MINWFDYRPVWRTWYNHGLVLLYLTLNYFYPWFVEPHYLHWSLLILAVNSFVYCVKFYRTPYCFWCISCATLKFKYESYQTNNLRELHSQTISKLKMHENVKITPIISINIVESKRQDYMISYTSWPIILPYMNAIGLMTSEELHSQSEGLTNKPTNRKQYTTIYKA